jgi:hypothetical protein
MTTSLQGVDGGVIRIPVVGPEPYNTVAYVRFYDTWGGNYEPAPGGRVVRHLGQAKSGLFITG